jgi:PEP-CTERM motif
VDGSLGCAMRRLRLCLLALLSALGLSAGPADSMTTISKYTFVGLCSDLVCPEGPTPGYGIGVLTLENYTPGAPLAASNFVDFTYLTGGFEIQRFAFESISGSLPGIFPSAASVDIEGNGAPHGEISFISSATGSWCAQYDGSKCNLGVGPSSSWSVPEPSTWAMTLAGFAGLGWLTARRRKLTPA